MKLLSSIAIAAVCLLAATPTQAGFQGVATIEGLASGTFEGHSFQNALVTFTGSYNTDDIFFTGISQGHFESLAYATGAVNVAGIGSADLGRTILESYSQQKDGIYPPSDIGMVFRGQSIGVQPGGFLVDGGLPGSHDDIDLHESFGPQGVGFWEPPPPIGYVVTSEGNLVISNIDFFSWTVEVSVAVPAPPSFVLAGLGLIGLPWLTRRKS